LTCEGIVTPHADASEARCPTTERCWYTWQQARAEIERLKIELTAANIYKAEYVEADEAMGDGPSTKNTLAGNIRALRAALKRCHDLLERAQNMPIIDCEARDEWDADVEAELQPCDESGSCPPAAKPDEVCGTCGGKGWTADYEYVDGLVVAETLRDCPHCHASPRGATEWRMRSMTADERDAYREIKRKHYKPLTPTPSAAGEREALYTGYEFHRGEWLAMYCNVKYPQTQHHQHPLLAWIRNDEAVNARSSRDGSGVTEEALAEAIQQEWTDEFEHPSPMACQAARVSLRMMGGEK
jgi:hypothetical protein